MVAIKTDRPEMLVAGETKRMTESGYAVTTGFPQRLSGFLLQVLDGVNG
jgi:hypothetical protein